MKVGWHSMERRFLLCILNFFSWIFRVCPKLQGNSPSSFSFLFYRYEPHPFVKPRLGILVLSSKLFLNFYQTTFVKMALIIVAILNLTNFLYFETENHEIWNLSQRWKIGVEKRFYFEKGLILIEYDNLFYLRSERVKKFVFLLESFYFETIGCCWPF